MGRGKAWTRDDFNKLDEGLKAGKTFEQIAGEIHRSVTAIRLRKYIDYGATRPVWSDAEKETLKREISKSDKELAELLGKTRVSVLNMRHRLGLGKIRKWGSEEDKIIRDNPTTPATTLAKQLNRTAFSVYMRRMLLKKNDTSENIKSSELIALALNDLGVNDAR